MKEQIKLKSQKSIYLFIAMNCFLWKKMRLLLRWSLGSPTLSVVLKHWERPTRNPKRWWRSWGHFHQSGIQMSSQFKKPKTWAATFGGAHRVIDDIWDQFGKEATRMWRQKEEEHSSKNCNYGRRKSWRRKTKWIRWKISPHHKKVQQIHEGWKV